MPEGPELETNELQEHVHAAHHHGATHEPTTDWIKSVSLTTAILAVFAAVGALQAGRLVNEAMMSQIRASDKWNEYQASKEKTHLYTVGGDLLTLAPGAKTRRMSDYKAELAKEAEKQTKLSTVATALEAESAQMMRRHERFAYEVALIQVAIALGAVSALTKVKSVWFISSAIGVVGAVLFVYGFAT